MDSPSPQMPDVPPLDKPPQTDGVASATAAVEVASAAADGLGGCADCAGCLLAIVIALGCTAGSALALWR